MDHMLDGLNEAQKAAATSVSTVLQVLAPPGSGKTKTLTTRTAYLIAHHGLNPRNLIVCTFTNKAAREVAERIASCLGNETASKLIIGTFHSIARRFLSLDGNLIGLDKKFGIADSADTKAILIRIIKRLKLDDSINAAVARGRISALKSRSITSDHYFAHHKKADEQQFALVYAEYEEQLHVSNLLDFDDLILRCAELLKHHPACVCNIEAVLIDEFQDTNNAQYDLMQLFAQHRQTITIVGDPDQSIYGWRNAEIGNLKRMRKQYPDTHVINLEDNYRSAAAILLAAQELIEQDESRPPKRLMPTHTVGFRPILRRLPSASAEASWIVSEIKRTATLTGDLLCWSDYAVLFRSSHHSRLVETALGKEGIPYRMVGGHRFFDRIEVRLVLDYLRVISHPAHNDALARVLNVPPRGIGATSIQQLLEEAQEDKVPLWKLVVNVAQGKRRSRTLLSRQAEQGIEKFFNIIVTAQNKLHQPQQDNSTLADFLSNIICRIDLQTYLKNLVKKDPEDYDSRWANIQELISQAAEFAAESNESVTSAAADFLDESSQTHSPAPVSVDDVLSKFLANVALSTDVTKDDKDGRPIAQVTLSTIHAAKGLEWPVVFIPAAYDGSIPHSRAEDQDEERRLLYVAMTRAQSLLYLSCPKKNSTSREKPGEIGASGNDIFGETTLSRFLTQKPMDVYFDKYGIDIGFEVAKEMATILRRTCPSAAVIENILRTCECLRDNRWPNEGEKDLEPQEWQIGAELDVFNNYGSRKPRQAGTEYQPMRKVDLFEVMISGHGFMPATTVQNRAEYSTSSATLKSTMSSAAQLKLSAITGVTEVRQVCKDPVVTISKTRKRRLSDAQPSLRNFFAEKIVGHSVKDEGAQGSQFHRVQAQLSDTSNADNRAASTISCHTTSDGATLSEKSLEMSADYKENGGNDWKPIATFHRLSTCQGPTRLLQQQRTGTRLGMLGRSHNGWASRQNK